MKSVMTALAAAAACTFFAGAAFAEPKTNLLHQWATGSDAQAIAKLGEMFTAKGGKWEQTSIAGHTANTLAKLRADVIAGNAPPAVQLKGPEIAEWNETGMTADLDELAASEGWEKVVAPELLPVMKPTGKWVAAPMNIHRINWLWASPKVMQAAGVAEMPKTWAEFNAACDKIVATGKICISHSTADWTDSTVFEVVLYGQDIDLYRKAFVEGDVESMRSPGMVKAFTQMRLMTSRYMDPGMVGRDWDSMSALVGKGDAAFHIMGDWTIGLLTAAGFKEGTDYVCAQAPTDWGKPGFILNSDSVVFFKQKDQDYIDGQKLLASLILSPDFQTVFNQAKGSIPARLDIDLSKGFNPCQQLSQKDLQASIKEGTLVRSMAHNMTIPQKMRGAIMDSITEFVATPDMSPEDGANAMADAAEAQK
ncbi:MULTISPECIES: ABC transporter substrate-binding protein [unclassified Mesorhizobium]|uniref:ABC transporter substrate-binding protein n=1 Tax=unclassified Mesorhizobium TaxID=325217 RepID=UPI0003CEFDE3|nr:MULTISPECIES: ABC transporter substrate-binding protein [unclassified Mesorhizobium]ESX20891.1 sugar ABC transporter substrate-binding protein [Mesorhizobium sp. LSJC255A00]ESX23703.1 sugar ABC transporter substrate-binding protein [Mesorhizobium sp. LSJC264A00]ESX31849.1 sugar ABC transporter substrate-binding protein [Mesorhizobium sp. LSHC440B00]ESX39433.1 sugar ABC transporter substrate-binding protein [Mesorhizobium sp. LSHC432A00]ESX44376.1 sugar ABC transporter substrate-binding prot